MPNDRAKNDEINRRIQQYLAELTIQEVLSQDMHYWHLKARKRAIIELAEERKKAS